MDTADTKALLLAALEIQDLFIGSLAHTRAGREQAATITIFGKTTKLANTQKDQWPISVNAISLSVDMHFGGFTPLHDSEDAEEEIRVRDSSLNADQSILWYLQSRCHFRSRKSCIRLMERP